MSYGTLTPTNLNEKDRLFLDVFHCIIIKLYYLFQLQPEEAPCSDGE